MTIITGSQFRANQGKYIDMVQKGERVVLSSKKGYTELKPVSKDDKEVREHKMSVTMMHYARSARKEQEEGKTLRFESAADAQKWMDTL